MRHYEAVVIGSPQLAGEKLDEVKRVFEEQVKKQDGKFLGSRDLGKRSFGFVIKKHREGNYFVFDFDLDPSKITDLKKTLSISDAILRHSILTTQSVAVSQSVETPHQHPSKPPLSAKA